MSEIQCFLLTETQYVRRELRRFAFDTQRICPVSGICDASVVIEEKLHKPREGKYETSPSWMEFDGHPMWPTVCLKCHQPFTPELQWQVNDHRLWENWQHGVLTTIRHDQCPVGAMFFADWYEGWGSTQWKERGGGPHLMVMTPGGMWDIDCGGSDDPSGSGWTREGEPPNVTAYPSIMIAHKYHGWLKNGRLIEC